MSKPTNRYLYKLKMLALIMVFVASGGGLAFSKVSHSDAASASANTTVSNWWPTDGASVSGEQPFQGVLDGVNLKNYDLFWTVNGTDLNLMTDTYDGSPHKQATVNVTPWNWQADNVYPITFIAKTKLGKELARTSFKITVPHETAAVIPALSTTVTASPNAATSSTTAAAPTSTTSSSSVVSAQPAVNFFSDPGSQARQAAAALRASRPADAALIDKIANRAGAKWFGGWNTNVQNDVNNFVTAAQGATPVLVTYNIPQRDCGGYSAGGTTSSEYLAWIRAFSAGIGARSAWVVLEPDAVAALDCLSTTDQATRLSLLSDAVTILKANPSTKVYIDSGNPRWQPTAVMADRLTRANVSAADGFSLNVSNFVSTAENTTYGQAIAAKIGGKHFVIDTSRNGLGPAAGNAWCNPDGRALGNAPTSQTGVAQADAFLWIKAPGESDGTCNGGPVAGAWWTDFALGLVKRSLL